MPEPLERRGERWGVLGRPAAPSAFSAVWGVAFVLRTASTDLDGRLRFSLFDDAMVSMRYAHNLAAGDGFRWNPGGGTVEGVTNPLWTAVMAAPHWLGVSTSYTSLVVAMLGVACVIGCVATSGRLASTLVPDDPFVATASRWLVATSYPLLFWSARGMEVGLLVLLVLLAADGVATIESQHGWRVEALVAASAAAATWVRMDALVPLVVIGAWATLQANHRGARWVWAGGVIGIASQTLARLAYFGEVVPNTFALKLGGVPIGARFGRGFEVVSTVGFQHLAALVLLAAIGFATRAVPSGAAQLLVGLTAGQVAYTVWVGGDAWEWMRYVDRFLVVAVPALAILAACGARRVRDAPLAVRVAATLALAISVVLGVGADFDGSSVSGVALDGGWIGVVAPVPLAALLLVSIRPSLSSAMVVAAAVVAMNLVAVDQWRTGALGVDGDQALASYGEVLHQATEPDAVVAVVNAGAPAYFAGRCAVDVLGKNDAVIAHEPPTRDYVLPGHMKWDDERSFGQLRPDLIAQLWDRSESSLAYVRSLGYLPIADGVLVLEDTDRVDVPVLVALLHELGVADAAVPAGWEPVDDGPGPRPCPQ